MSILGWQQTLYSDIEVSKEVKKEEACLLTRKLQINKQQGTPIWLSVVKEKQQLSSIAGLKDTFVSH